LGSCSRNVLLREIGQEEVMGGPNTAHRMLHSLLPVLHDCGNAFREAGLQADQLFNIKHVCDNMLRYRC